MSIAIVILAAGRSSRMRGKDKLLQEVGGVPLLTRIASEACASGLPVWVMLPTLGHPRAAVLPKGVTPLGVPDADEGMAASIRTAVAALPDTCDGVMIVPADMPELTQQDFQRLAAAFDTGAAAILRACSDTGQPGHPVLFPRDLFKELATLGGDKGAASVLRRHASRVRAFELAGQRALTDLDTPEDWAAWRARQDDGSAM